MAYPSKVFAATISGGVYYTDSFTGPGGAQPTWTPVNGGLASLEMDGLQLDPTDQEGTQYALAAGVLYKRTGGDWEVILSAAESRDWAGSAVAGSVKTFCIDPITGYLHAYFSHSVVQTDPPVYPYVLTSQDGGVTWLGSVLDNAGAYPWFERSCSNIQAYNGVVVVCHQSWVYTTYIFHSDDSGVTWASEGTANGSSVALSCHLCRNDTGLAYVNFFGAAPYTNAWHLVAKRLGSLSWPLVQDDKAIGPYSWDGLWSDPDDATRVASLAHSIATKMWRTTDAWHTLVDNAQADSDVTYLRVICPQSKWGEWILGRIGAVGCLRISADGVTTEDKSGTNNALTPYTGAIPETSGGIMSIQAVIVPVSEGPTPPPGSTIVVPGIGTVTLSGTGGTVQAVSMPGYTGTRRGVPMPGDRAAWDDMEYDSLHARDIASHAFVHHMDPDNPPPRTLADLNDVNTTGVADGDALLYDEDTGTWLPADVLTPTELAATDAADLTSGASTDGQVLTSDGAGGAAWEDSAGGASSTYYEPVISGDTPSDPQFTFDALGDIVMAEVTL